MFTFKPSKKSALFIYLVLFAATGMLSLCVIYFEDFLGILSKIIVLILWTATVIFAFFIIPAYYIYTKIIITNRSISKQTVFFTHKYQIMSVNSVVSVTMLITPFSRFTGLNAAIINALGARMIIPFISKKDCIKINEYLKKFIENKS